LLEMKARRHEGAPVTFGLEGRHAIHCVKCGSSQKAGPMALTTSFIVGPSEKRF
jgi:hypothetical protein